MDKSLKSFMSLLFDEGEETCFSPDTYGTAVFPIDQIVKGGPGPFKFFSINPLNHYRLDRNVSTFRNFLLEFDSGTEKQQLDFIKEIGLPFSACTHSGSVSVHVLISLSTPCKNEADYRELAYRLHAKVPGADPSTINPSRFSRLPEAVRVETGLSQRVIERRRRISTMELEQWLGPAPEKPKATATYSTSGGGLSNTTVLFLFNGAERGKRNRQLFQAACDFAKSGYLIGVAKGHLEQAFDFDGKDSDFTELEFNRTIESAYRRVDFDLTLMQIPYIIKS